MMLAIQSHELIPIAVERTLDSLVGGLALTAIAWTWLRVARRQNSASRFLILFILLIGIAVLPIVGFSWLTHASTGELSSTHPVVTLPEHAAEYLFVAWAVMALAGLTRIAAGFVQLRRLHNSCVPVETATLDERINNSLLASPRAAVLCTSDRVNVPTALGFARPARIVIPSWLMDQLSPDELHHLVLHELAHLRRWDDWSNLTQKILGALLFFHPAVWWLQRRLALEREMACDECVLAETGDARAYAKSLANMAERSFVRRTVALAQAAVSRLHDTTLRVAKILSPSTQRAATVPVMLSVAAVGSLTIAVAFFSPDLISFTAPTQSPSVASYSGADLNTTPRPDLKPTLASMRIAEPRRLPKPVTRKKSAEPAALQARAKLATPKAERNPELIQAKATLDQKPAVVPAKATLNQQQVSHPAVLVFWQETYDDGYGNVIQRSFWRVVVLNHVPKEPSKKA